jgi:hypothetical protein
MKNKEISRVRTYNDLLGRIAEILAEARTKVVREINRTQVLAYWEIGKEIVEFEQKGKARGGYGEQLIERLSADMTQKFGRGFSPTNLKMMRLFYQNFPIRQTLSDESIKEQKPEAMSGKSAIQQTLSVKSQKQQRLPAVSTTQGGQFEPMLSWSHYCELLKVEKPLAR